MHSAMVVMQDSTAEKMLEMPLAKRDEKIQALPPDRSHHPFASGICLGRTERRPQYAHAHSPYGLIQVSGEDVVPVMDEEAERMIIGERFSQLLDGPFCAGMIGDIEV